MFATEPPRAVVALLVLLGACATNSAPTGFLPPPREAGSAGYGGWIEVTYRSEGQGRRVAGELIAVDGDSIWVLGPAERLAVGAGSVLEARVTGYASGAGDVMGYTLLGVLSTASNGLLSIFTAPLWLIVGSAAAEAQSRVPLASVPPMTWSQLALFARFPQGLPSGIGLADLRPKP